MFGSDQSSLAISTPTLKECHLSSLHRNKAVWQSTGVQWSLFVPGIPKSASVTFTPALRNPDS